MNDAQMNLFVTMPEGATLPTTDIKTRKLEEKVMEIPVVDKLISQVSEGEAVLTVMLVEGFKDLDTVSVEDVQNKLRSISSSFEDMDISLDEPPRARGGQSGVGSSASSDFERMLGIGSPRNESSSKVRISS